MSLTTYPLCWPPTVKRTKRRSDSRFKTTLAGALGNVQTSLQKFARDSQIGIEDIVISSNLTTGITRPRDPGVAIWFTWDSRTVCIPNDRYDTVEGNLQGIYKVLEARRVELRHGTLEMVRATFSGFQLAAPTSKPWWKVLGVSEHADREAVQLAYRRLASAHHPDRGGDGLTMTDINAAWEQAQWTIPQEDEALEVVNG
jgi:hypothetical protein